MDASLPELVAAISTIAGICGVSVKFWLDRVTAKQKEMDARQGAMETRLENERTRFEAERVRHELKLETERLRFEAVMNDQITEMRRELHSQEREIVQLRRVSDAYRNHIMVLENLMRAASMIVPTLQLPVDRDLPRIGGDRDERGRRRADGDL